MKRWIAFGIGLVLLVMAAVLSSTAVPGEDFAGKWYSPEGEAYVFHNGIVTCQDNTFAGAYAFDRDSVVLFVNGVEGLEEVRELYLEENTLYDRDSGSAYLRRNTE